MRIGRCLRSVGSNKSRRPRLVVKGIGFMFRAFLFPLRCISLAHWIQNCSLLPMLVLAVVVGGAEHEQACRSLIDRKRGRLASVRSLPRGSIPANGANY